MTTSKKILLGVLGIILILGVGVLGFNFYQNKQKELQEIKEAERIQQEEEERQRQEQERLAQEQRALDNMKAQLVSGNYDENLKVVFLTFDDGPAECSNEVLDILNRNGIKATFFTNGHVGPEYEEIYRRIVNEGHVLANHTYSHNYDYYSDTETFINDVKKQEDYLRSVTGVEPAKVFRFPGGSNITNMANINALLALGYNYYDWTASAGDGASVILPAEGVISKILTEVHEHQVNVILCHGENPAKTTTREALDSLISQLKAEGYTFLTLDPSYNLADSKFMVS